MGRPTGTNRRNGFKNGGKIKIKKNGTKKTK